MVRFCRRNPRIAAVTAIAAAQYRLGKYADAVKTVAGSEERRSGPSVEGRAILTMAQYKLGDIAKARAGLAELLKMKGTRPDLIHLLDEAESLLRSNR
jgi:hypothetical protein